MIRLERVDTFVFFRSKTFHDDRVRIFFDGRGDSIVFDDRFAIVQKDERFFGASNRIDI